jgi:hypothetical protein
MTGWLAQYGVLYKAMVGEVLAEMKDPRGPVLLDEVYDAAMNMPVLGEQAIFQRGRVAVAYAERNVDDALALLAPVQAENDRDRSELERELGDLAQAVAPQDPKQALEILQGIHEATQREQHAKDVIWHFSAESLDLALSTARAMADPSTKAIALAHMAQIAPHDQTQLSGPRSGGAPMPEVLGALACLARRMGYSRWDEWARLYAAQAWGAGERNLFNAEYDEYRDLGTIKLMALTEPALARHALEALIRRLGGWDQVSGDSQSRAIGIAAGIDPSWAQELLAKLPADRRDGNGLVRVIAAGSLVSALLQTPEKRERQVLNGEVYGPWLLPTDDEMPR